MIELAEPPEFVNARRISLWLRPESFQEWLLEFALVPATPASAMPQIAFGTGGALDFGDPTNGPWNYDWAHDIVNYKDGQHTHPETGGANTGLGGYEGTRAIGPTWNGIELATNVIGHQASGVFGKVQISRPGPVFGTQRWTQVIAHDNHIDGNIRTEGGSHNGVWKRSDPPEFLTLFFYPSPPVTPAEDMDQYPPFSGRVALYGVRALEHVKEIVT